MRSYLSIWPATGMWPAARHAAPAAVRRFRPTSKQTAAARPSRSAGVASPRASSHAATSARVGDIVVFDTSGSAGEKVLFDDGAKHVSRFVVACTHRILRFKASVFADRMIPQCSRYAQASAERGRTKLCAAQTHRREISDRNSISMSGHSGSVPSPHRVTASFSTPLHAF
jgi:hypothetical protein